jgi:hypothetical protein
MQKVGKKPADVQLPGTGIAADAAMSPGAGIDIEPPDVLSNC